MEIGDKLGRYEVRRKIGEGGMGEVYLAYDEQLHREVVIKMLLRKFSQDKELVGRFKLEARAVSALNHPNIITIHEIVEQDELLFIVYEFIEGKTLRDKIIQRTLSIADSVKIFEQIARGLSAAHQAGIIHRDIKPENIMIRQDGYVKILDFGLAKQSIFEIDSEDETQNLVETKKGTIMGSIQYMSPEQARGEKMDERTDIWSLGVIFYETLTNNNPFAATTMSDSIALILRSDPAPASSLKPDITSNLQTILERSLQKKRDDRYRTIKQILWDLDVSANSEKEDLSNNVTVLIGETQNTVEQNLSSNPLKNAATQDATDFDTNKQKTKTVETGGKSKQNFYSKFGFIPLALSVLCFLLIASGLGAWFYTLSSQAEVPFQKIQIEPLTKDKNADLVSLSADGKILAYVKGFSGTQTMCVRRLESGEEIDLVKPKKGSFNSVHLTKDGNFVYYVLEDSGDGKLFKIPASGGTPEKIGENIHSEITFSPNEQKFAFLRLNAAENIARVFIVNADGTNLKEFISSKDIGYNSILDVVWSPDGNKLLLAALGKVGETLQMVEIGTLDISETDKAKSAKEFKVLNSEGWRVVQSANWLRDGSGIIFIGGKSADKTKQIYHLDYPRGKTTKISNDTSNYNRLDVSADNRVIVASKVSINSSLWSFDIESKKADQISPETETLLNFTQISVSKDGRIYYSKLEGEAINIYSINSDGKNLKQITRNSWNMGANLIQDDKYILTTGKTSDGFIGVVRLNADGTNPVFLTRIKDKMDLMPQLADNGTVIFMRLGLDWSFPKLMKVNINGGEVSNIFNDNQKLEMYPQISPDGKLLAYVNFFSDSVSNAIKIKIKIVDFANGKAAETVLEKDVDQVTQFAWTPDSKNLIYLEPNKKTNLIQLSLATEDETEITDFSSRIMEGAFTISHNGKKIYTVRSSENRELVLIKKAD